MENSLNDVCDRLQEKFNLLDEAVKELKKGFDKRSGIFRNVCR